MRTEIKKSFSWGFVATEQDFRRLIQTANDQLLKPAGSVLSDGKYTVKLKDGSVIETNILDDIFLLENVGNKLIQEVSCNFASTHPNGTCTITVELRDGSINEKKWDSASYLVSGDTRDWAFVAASELDERLRRMKVVAWESILAKRSAFALIYFVSMMVAMFGSVYFVKLDTVHLQLQDLYAAGELANPIEAIIALERIKANRSPTEALMPMFYILGMLSIVFFGGGYVLSKISPSYNFCWGEYNTQYSKRIRIRNAVFTLVVLSLIISIFANFISKKLGI